MEKEGTRWKGNETEKGYQKRVQEVTRKEMRKRKGER